MRRCDIIIPVYNAHDCVVACVESVLNNTNFDNAHLILIDDKSSDERIVPLLGQYAEKHPEEITFLKNKNNLGFVGTVNRGMRYSENDVLLLNSDTEVPEGWLERIQSCAYGGEMIATVTPLSNNATLASVPKIFERNELPNGYDLAEMNKIVEKYSMKLYPNIPTAHGFCMYIKREALDMVGYFDEETFGRGYGEENDFCFRCMRMGYRNVLCDDVYVMHKESQSFLDTKEDHQGPLMKKHPGFTEALSRWCADRDMKNIGENVALGMGVEDERPNVLVVVHDFTSAVGGTTLHVADLTTALRDKYNFHVVFRDGAFYKVRSYFRDYDMITSVYRRPMDLTRAKNSTDLAPDELYSHEYELMIEEMLDNYKISFVHIHHILWHYFDIVDICLARGIKYIISLHDMYLGFPIANNVAMEVKRNVVAPMDEEMWRKTCEKLLNNAEYVIAPSEAIANKYKEFYKRLKVKIIPHGMSLEKVPATHRLKPGVKNIAFVGGIAESKGSKILEQLLPALESRGGVNVHLFGLTVADVGDSKIFVDHGMYDRGDLPKLLKEASIDLVCNFSLSFESYAYVVDEVAACGIPSLVFDFGASGDRIKRYGLGWAIKYTNNVAKLVDVIEGILSDAENYDEIVELINKYEVRGVRDMAKNYAELYDMYVKSGKLNYDVLRRKMDEVDIMERAMLTTNEYSRRLRVVDIEYNKIATSIRWGVVRKIRLPAWVSRLVRRFVHGRK